MVHKNIGTCINFVVRLYEQLESVCALYCCVL